ADDWRKTVLARVTTRAGDQGYTGLLGSGRVPKYDDRIEALGLIDEATSALGLARASTNEERARQLILQWQTMLYHVMAEVAATPDAAPKLNLRRVEEADLADLERASEDLKREVEIGNRFIIPGESFPGAALDLARTVIRRAERHVARMTHRGEVTNPDVLRYLNRLSDAVFILARYVERDHRREVS
ncbi:MAG: cob(I)yrinic acid a,c-diamide adenosyltransferase, partial [Chloroflexota bacterium]